ncbi:MAG: prepilin-type N-terminal cleavage/methylation domain-containing protein [SAR202 cluster bacterium]|nr:prepilin-type N-terminal cleavage/methylation domain-containing protein [SAR202 cluster bacterium]
MLFLTSIGRDQRGFSLIETVLAVTLLGLVVTGLLAGLSVAMKTGRSIQQQAAAANAATTHIEDYLASGTVSQAALRTAPTGEPEGILSVSVLSTTTTAPVEQRTIVVTDATGSLLRITTHKVLQAP